MEIINLDDRRNAKLKERRLWMERLWQWADQLDIEEYNVPRNEHELFNLTHLSFESYRYYVTFPRLLDQFEVSDFGPLLPLKVC